MQSNKGIQHKIYYIGLALNNLCKNIFISNKVPYGPLKGIRDGQSAALGPFEKRCLS